MDDRGTHCDTLGGAVGIGPQSTMHASCQIEKRYGIEPLNSGLFAGIPSPSVTKSTIIGERASVFAACGAIEERSAQ